MAARSVGGVQVASVTECVVSAVAWDIIALLNGSTTSSTLARDSLREAMSLPGAEADGVCGLVVNALRFSAGYGIYVSLSTDRFVSRTLDAIARRRGRRHLLMIGRYDQRAFEDGAAMCRVGRLANSIRRVFNEQRSANLQLEVLGHAQDRWEAALGGLGCVTARECAEAVREAAAQSHSDWLVERELFDAPSGGERLQEDCWRGHGMTHRAARRTFVVVGWTPRRHYPTHMIVMSHYMPTAATRERLVPLLLPRHVTSDALANTLIRLHQLRQRCRGSCRADMVSTVAVSMRPSSQVCFAP